jgi:hypothetical protein
VLDAPPKRWVSSFDGGPDFGVIVQSRTVDAVAKHAQRRVNSSPTLIVTPALSTVPFTHYIKRRLET